MGLDVGGTKIRGLAVDETGAVLGRAQVSTNTATAQTAVESIVRAVNAILCSANACSEPLTAIGLGIPGKVQDGVVSLAVNLNLSSFPLAGWLSRQFAAPVYLENDVRAAALGAYAWVQEHCCAGGPEINNVIFLSIGTGISAGVILNGKLHRGVNGMAGEVGHAVIDPRGAECKCGSRGCLETVAAGWGIARQAAAAVEKAHRAGQVTRLAGFSPLTAEDVYSAARAGDALALEITRRVGFYLSRCIYNLLMTYDVDRVVVGGGISRAGEAFFSPVREELQRMSAQSPLVMDLLSVGGRVAGKVLLLPPDAEPAERGVIALAQQSK